MGTRGSPLALAQARRVADRLQERVPGLALELITVRTAGDRDRRRPLDAFPEPGAFVKELERALADRRIDLAVHSAKDVPTSLPPGLVLAAFPERVAPWDVLVTRRRLPVEDGLPVLPPGARVATGSVRRRAQWLRWRPDLAVAGLRGNVDTRLRRLAAGECDAVVLAAAGLVRLGLLPERAGPGDGPLPLPLPGGGEAWAYPLDPVRFVPAPGQGALAVEVRADDAAVRAAVEAIDQPAVAAALRAERAFLAAMGATCAVPLGAHARVEGGTLVLHAFYAGAADPYGSERGSPAEAEAVGRRLAARLGGGGSPRGGGP